MTNDIAATEDSKPGFNKRHPWITWGIIVLIAFFIVGACSGGDDKEPSKAVTSDETSEVKEQKKTESGAQTKAAAEPKTNKKLSLAARMREELGDTDVDWTKVGQYGDRVVTVTFNIDDNLSADMIATGAKEQTVDIIKQAQDVGARQVDIMGYFPMVDQYGNTEKDMILSVGYSGQVLKRINTKEILVQDGIWSLANETTYVHPELR